MMKTRGRSRIGAAAIAAGALVLMSAGADERQRCNAHHRATRVEGSFSMPVVGGEACTPPISRCTHGTLSGDLPGSYDAVFDSLQPAGDPNAPLERGLVRRRRAASIRNSLGRPHKW
jgi:hypothetical protein